MPAPNIVVLVTGGIAAYKAPLVVRELMRRGARVKVAMTRSAQRFVGPLTFAGLTGEPPLVDLWDASKGGEAHVDLARWADVLVVAPATASVLARMTTGLADCVVTATLLCARGPVLVAPAMHTRMWEHAATRENVATLRARGIRFVGPEEGALASGEDGLGRMAEPVTIAAEALLASAPRDLAGQTILVTAGPTHEAIDPVRFIGNRSSGKMGFALAERAAHRGARVVLVSGPVSLAAPPAVELVRVRTAIEMQAAIAACVAPDAIVMAAAVADYRPREASAHKEKKREGEDTRTLALVQNPDILLALGEERARSGSKRPVLIGFAVETEDLIAAARRKLMRKKVDLVVANHASVAFEGSASEVTLVDSIGATPLGMLPKHEAADRILDRVALLLAPE